MPTPQISRFGILLSRNSRAAKATRAPARQAALADGAATTAPRFRHLQPAAEGFPAHAPVTPPPPRLSPAASTAAAILRTAAICRGEVPAAPITRPNTAANRQATATAAAIIAAGKRRRGEAP